MARVTVEDCIVKVPNRFDLVMLAAQRARELSSGTRPTIEPDNDKNPVIALREIADGTVETEELHHALIHGLQRHAEVDEPEDEALAHIAPVEEWPSVESEHALKVQAELDDGDAVEDAGPSPETGEEEE